MTVSWVIVTVYGTHNDIIVLIIKGYCFLSSVIWKVRIGCMKRTLAAQTTQSVGKTVELCGWVDTLRKHGKIVFIDLRDRSGRVQLVATKDQTKLRVEEVIKVTGKVVDRAKEMINPDLATGTVEVVVDAIEVLSRASDLPFSIDGDGYEISEEIRLKYRYLDLRRDRMQHIMRLRSQFVRELRDAFYARDFVEVETPLLTKSTKEGARDFLVPSRFQPGKFYALPQSPQQYKQLLMTAGIERYFQIARCMRDEDLRADRGFEFTQLDVEMSFVTQKDVMETIEDIVKTAVTAVGGKLRDQQFPVIEYQDALKKYGADKFDLRNEAEKKAGVLAFAWVVKFPFFKRVDKGDVAELRDGKSGWTFTHNPFSTPIPEHVDWHLKGEHIDQIITAQYDLVCNGYEAGGGSIRAHRPEVLKATMKIMGYSDTEIEENIGHMLEAFSMGTPPHGGLALGLDRLVMLLAGETSLKETIAFPMTSTGRTAVMDAPSAVSDEQLVELGLSKVSTQQSSVFERIVNELSALKVEHHVSQHAPVKTSEEAAHIRGVSLAAGAKALVCYADATPIMIVVPGDKKLDMTVFKKLYAVKDLRMASKEEVEKVTTVQIGAVPPFGHIFDIPLYVDQSLLEQSDVFFNPGRHDRTIKMSVEEYKKFCRGTFGSFTK